MDQEIKKLMYHSEEVLMNNNFSLDKVSKLKKHWKHFKVNLVSQDV